MASMLKKAADVVVCGGGVVGSSVALHLAARRPDLAITVLEKDPTYARASAPLSAGGIRQQFSNAENVRLSVYGAAFLKGGLAELARADPADVQESLGFREAGYLTLASEAHVSVLRDTLKVQHENGATWLEVLDASQLEARFPWLDTEGVAAGTFGSANEGYFDPWGLLNAMRRGAEARGVRFEVGEVAGIEAAGGVATAVVTRDGRSIPCGAAVNAAGAFAAGVAPPGAAPSLPIEPRRRCIFAISCPEPGEGKPRPPGDAPLVVDVSGSYFRGDLAPGRFLCGASPPADRDPRVDADALDDVDHALFEETIWPALAQRVPAFEALRVEASWAGLYEYCTLDQNAVVGPHPDAANVVVAAGFSGHGLQHAPGVGRGVAELLDAGRYETIDLAPFSYDRVISKAPFREANIW